MNKKICTCVVVIMLTASVFSQQNEKLKKALYSASPKVKTFHKKLTKAETGNTARLMIFSLGKTGDKDFIPYLKALLTTGECKRCIEVVLVQLGETSYVKKAVAEVDAQLKPICMSPYPVRKQDDFTKCGNTISLQENALWKLARFKTKESYQKLYELLDNTTNRNLEENTDYFIPTLSNQTMYQLCQTVDNPPVNAKGNGCPNDIEIWKTWFEKSGLLDN